MRCLRILLLVVSGVLLFAPLHAQKKTTPKPSPPASAKIQGQEFVSFELSFIGSRGSTIMKLTPGSMKIQRESHAASAGSQGASRQKETTVTLSSQDRTRLLGLIEKANFPALQPRYEDKESHDAGYQNTVLTLREKGGKEKVYRVYNFGRKAPPAYYSLISEMWVFADKNTP
jgi:hypothetical protein